MTVAGNDPLTAAPQDDPVRTALVDPAVGERLLRHAHALLRRQTYAHGIDVDDVLQKTKLRAMEIRSTFTTGRAVGPWLHGILVKVVLEEHRAAQRQPAQQPVESTRWENSIAAPDGPDGDAIATRAMAERCLNRLTASDREIVRMRFFDGLGLQEIAERLNITHTAARARFSRAMKRLHELAETSNPEDRP